MNIGILDDGSLSSRLKGDIYWKKQKLMLRVEADQKKANKGTRHFMTRFEEEDAPAEGSTAVGAIEKMLKETSDLSGEYIYEDDPAIRDSCISPGRISEYAEYIPENYVSQIKNGSLKVVTYHKNEEFLGLLIRGVHNDWMELVWLSLPQENTEENAIKTLISHIVWQAKIDPAINGVFAELHIAPETERMKRLLAEVGMQIKVRKNNLYECTVKDVKEDRTLLAAAKKISCVPLLFMSDTEMDEIERIIYEDTGNVPVPLPIPWSSYRQDLSIVHYDAGKKTLGALFVSKVGDTLVIDLLYGKNPMVTAAILGSSIQTAKEELTPDQKILVPIVLEATRPIIEKIAPNATREDLVEAFIRF